MQPPVSIVIPCRNEVDFIASCLEAIRANDYPGEQMEVIVVDGMSDDGTRVVVARFDEVKLVDNPRQTTPHALNMGIRASKGEFIIRVDAHAEIHPDYISRCVALLQTIPKVGCVGGVFENVYSNRMGRVISMALSSSFGVGDARYRLRAEEGPVDTVPFGAFPRWVFNEIGLFDEELLRNQDDDFTFRLRRAGYVVWLDPKIRVRYHVRSSLSGMARQFRQYGFWKVYVNRKHGVVTTLRQLVPPLFVLALVTSAIGSFFSKYVLIGSLSLIGIYLITAKVAAVLKTRNIPEVVSLVGCFLVLHLSYGIGYWQGIWRFMILGKKPRPAHGTLTR